LSSRNAEKDQEGHKNMLKSKFKTRAEYQKWYRNTHPEYVKRCRELEKPKLKRYQANTEKHKREKIINDWLRQGMFIDGWKIEITHLYNGKVENNRKMVSHEMAFDSHNQILLLTFEKMLDEMGIRSK